MTSPTQLQYYTMAHSLRGYAERLDENKDEDLVHMLMRSAFLLEHAWDEYQQTLHPDQRIGS